MLMGVMIMRTLASHETLNGSLSSKHDEAICHQRLVADKCADKIAEWKHDSDENRSGGGVQ